jgi:signal transduction histidine kinase
MTTPIPASSAGGSHAIATPRPDVVSVTGRHRDQLLAGLAHELRLPLSHIKGFVSSLRRTDVHWDDATRRDFLAEIEVETDRLAELVEALTQANAPNGVESSTAERVLTSPTALVEGGLHRVRRLLRNRPVSLDVSPSLPPVCVDPAGMERVLANLLQNAVKYSPPATAIWISAHVVAGNELELCVQDEGPGVSPKDRQRIFEPFFRKRTSEQTNVPGHGLGLAICKSSVIAHGGSIRVDERPGGGASFTVALPVPLVAGQLGKRTGTEGEEYEPANNSCCGRRDAHAQAHHQQPQGEWLRRSHRGRRDGGAQADRGAPLRPAVARHLPARA